MERMNKTKGRLLNISNDTHRTICVGIGSLNNEIDVSLRTTNEHHYNITYYIKPGERLSIRVLRNGYEEN